MIYLIIGLALLAAGEIILACRVTRLERERAETESGAREEKFAEAVAEILSYDLERAREAMKNE